MSAAQHIAHILLQALQRLPHCRPHQRLGESELQEGEHEPRHLGPQIGLALHQAHQVQAETVADGGLDAGRNARQAVLEDVRLGEAAFGEKKPGQYGFDIGVGLRPLPGLLWDE